ncbi:hexokinase-4, chloroplastic [Triticum aestivum]|nr:hexokinase-4, chloroplastic-like [Triticum aestivum]
MEGVVGYLGRAIVWDGPAKLEGCTGKVKERSAQRSNFYLCLKKATRELFSCHLPRFHPIIRRTDHSQHPPASLDMSAAVGSPYRAAPAAQHRRKGRAGAVTLRCSKVAAAAAAPILDDLRLQCATPLPLLRHVAGAMAAGMRAGLAVDGAGELKMIPSYVYSLPTGSETGLFYALDLGGTNFRVLRVQLGGKDGRVVDTESEQVSIPKEIMHGTTEELFDFIAARLSNFVAKEGGNFHLQEGRKREIGFTFSFPVKQTSIDSGILIKWTKGFAVSGTAGKDVVACLNAAMERQGLDMSVSALVNDTVGALAGAHYWDEDVMVAVILGTGTNACYIERTESIPKLQHLGLGTGNTIINTEWGAFSDGLPLTEFDRDMDAESINPGEQIFEKTISGMYLGEIVRRVLASMAQESDLFGHSFADKLTEPFVLRTPHLCAMQQDNSDDLGEVESILRDIIGVNQSSVAARRVIVEVSDCIVKRGGRLAGAGIAGILQKMENDSKGLILGRRTVVAMDGGLYENYPQYRLYMVEAMAELLGPQDMEHIVVEHTKDGSGIGAALLAAANSKYAAAQHSA